MKKNYSLLLILFVLFANAFSAQQNLYLGINDVIISQPNSQQLKVSLKVTGGTYGEYLSYKTAINQNEITLSVCYSMTDAAVMTYFDNDFYVDIPATPNNYILKVNVYYSDGVICNYINLDDTATLNFSTPIEATVSLNTIESKNVKDISLFPIPTKDILNINTKAEINKVNIYDASGRLIREITENTSKINTLDLKSGVYYIEIFTDKKRWYKKFIIQK